MERQERQQDEKACKVALHVLIEQITVFPDGNMGWSTGYVSLGCNGRRKETIEEKKEGTNWAADNRLIIPYTSYLLRGFQ